VQALGTYLGFGSLLMPDTMPTPVKFFTTDRLGHFAEINVAGLLAEELYHTLLGILLNPPDGAHVRPSPT
jgi:predicted O-methyltransferase YrrM